MKSDKNMKKQIESLKQKILSKKGLRFASFSLFLGSGIIGSFSRIVIKEIHSICELATDFDYSQAASRVLVPRENSTGQISVVPMKYKTISEISTTTSHVSYSVEMIVIALALLISAIVLFYISIKKK